MTYATIPGDCIDFLTSRNGERVDFERLETPRPAPEVTLKKKWQNQQQHSCSCTDVPSLVKNAVKEHCTGVQDGSKHSTDVTTSPGKLGQTASNMETETVFQKEDITDTISKTEIVKKETNTEAIDENKMVPNKICIRNDLAKENMMFSPESRQAIMDMRSVESIELKKSRVQCPSCPHFSLMWKTHQIDRIMKLLIFSRRLSFVLQSQ